MKYSYFPGCSLEKNAAAYHISSMAITGPLGIDLQEIDDWNCCGATEYISLNLTASYALIARNLAQATKNPDSKQVVAPCSACYLNLKKCDRYMAESKKLSEKVNQALAAGGLSYKPGTLKVRHLLDVVVNDVGWMR
jgi:heterodisulfide reductase subunit B2